MGRVSASACRAWGGGGVRAAEAFLEWATLINDPDYPHVMDGDHDDLPRTLRRERDARERERREREQAHAHAQGHMQGGPSLSAAPPAGFGSPQEAAGFQTPIEIEAPAARVTAFDVPFGHLVLFFLKSALAAIPALILLGAFLWFAGHLAQMFFPQLVKMQILIMFPNGSPVVPGAPPPG